MTRKARIHVIGSYAVGMTMRTGQFPKPGETVPGYNFNQFHGGKGSNQAVGAVRMGAEVLFTSSVGNDEMGSSAIEMLKKEGIRTDSVFRTSECSTGVGIVIVGDSGENEIVIDLAANEKLTAEQIDYSFDCGFDADLLLVQLEANLEAVHHALRLAKDRNIPSIINPAPYRAIPEDFIRLASFITPNQTEAAALLGEGGTPAELCRRLKTRYEVEVVLTAGSDGAYYTRGDEVLHSPGRKTETVDTTGAGDCFNAALAVMLAENKDVSEALEAANCAASCSVEKEGVVESLPCRNDIREIMNTSRRS